MDDTGNRETTFKEERMDATVWVELVLIVLRLVAAGMAG